MMVIKDSLYVAEAAAEVREGRQDKTMHWLLQLLQEVLLQQTRPDKQRSSRNQSWRCQRQTTTDKISKMSIDTGELHYHHHNNSVSGLISRLHRERWLFARDVQPVDITRWSVEAAQDKARLKQWTTSRQLMTPDVVVGGGQTKRYKCRQMQQQQQQLNPD